MKNTLLKIKKTLKKARIELNFYSKKPKKRFSSLLKSCEQVWLAFNLLVEAKSGAKVKTRIELKHKAYELNLSLLYELTRNLHFFYFNKGSAALYEEEVIRDIKEAIHSINDELRKFIYAQSKEGKDAQSHNF